MSKLKKYGAGLIISSVVFATSAEATGFWLTGKITRTLTDSIYYSGCMVLMNTPVGNGGNLCPTNGWVSLDCKALFNGNDVEGGMRMFSTATSAAMAGKTVSLYINDSNRVNGYCVASRIDVIY